MGKQQQQKKSSNIKLLTLSNLFPNFQKAKIGSGTVFCGHCRKEKIKNNNKHKASC